MSWLSTINHTSSFCYRASCCPWLEFAWENGGSRSPSRYVSRSQDDTGQHLRPSEVAQCAKAFAHPAIAWGFRGNIIEYRNDIEISNEFCRSEFSMVITVLYGRLVLGCETDSQTQVQLHVPGWRKIRRVEKSKGHDGLSIWGSLHRILCSGSEDPSKRAWCFGCLLFFIYYLSIFEEFYWWNGMTRLEQLLNWHDDKWEQNHEVLLEHWRQDKEVATGNDDPEVQPPHPPQNGGVL